MTPNIFARRGLLLGAGTAGITLLGAPARAGEKSDGGQRRKEHDKKDEEEIGPGEDLMREHGVLRRVLLVYREAGRRLAAANDPETVTSAVQSCARLIRRFVEDYHERQEEEFVFPRFERAKKLTELVGVLRAQHHAGRKTTDQIQTLATALASKDPRQRRQLITALDAFVRMYEPHAAREDTVLFPALHEITTRTEYDALGEDFERREHQLFGGDGFAQAVAEIEGIEKKMGMENLAAFTP
jgi:hemerythrin-like domain-containing protein